MRSVALLLLCLLASSTTATELLDRGSSSVAVKQTWEDWWTVTVTVASNVYAFLSGVPFGLQGSWSIPSQCVESYYGISGEWDKVVKEYGEVVQAGMLSGWFDLLKVLDGFLIAAVGCGERCQIWLLSSRFSALFTLSGFLYYSDIVYLNLDYIRVPFRQDNGFYVLEDLYNGFYRSAGIGAGQILSRVLDFSF